jgi:hypothetical protein
MRFGMGQSERHNKRHRAGVTCRAWDVRFVACCKSPVARLPLPSRAHMRAPARADGVLVRRRRQRWRPRGKRSLLRAAPPPARMSAPSASPPLTDRLAACLSARRPLHVACRILSAARCLVHVVCYLLFVAQCLVARFPLYGVCCMLSAERVMLRVVCCTLSAGRCLLHVVWCTLSVACLSYVVCCVSSAARCLPHVVRCSLSVARMLSAARFLLHVFCCRCLLHAFRCTLLSTRCCVGSFRTHVSAASCLLHATLQVSHFLRSSAGALVTHAMRGIVHNSCASHTQSTPMSRWARVSAGQEGEGGGGGSSHGAGRRGAVPAVHKGMRVPS